MMNTVLMAWPGSGVAVAVAVDVGPGVEVFVGADVGVAVALGPGVFVLVGFVVGVAVLVGFVVGAGVGVGRCFASRAGATLCRIGAAWVPGIWLTIMELTISALAARSASSHRVRMIVSSSSPTPQRMRVSIAAPPAGDPAPFIRAGGRRGVYGCRSACGPQSSSRVLRRHYHQVKRGLDEAWS
jgi:hypothetical protein